MPMNPSRKLVKQAFDKKKFPDLVTQFLDTSYLMKDKSTQKPNGGMALLLKAGDYYKKIL